MGCASSVQTELQASTDAAKVSSLPAAPQPSSEDYQMIKVLGEGASCKVMLVKHLPSGLMNALKVLLKVEEQNRGLWQNETRILQELRHPNVVELYASFEDSQAFCIVTGFCQGGELFDRVRVGSFSEQMASVLARQMLQAVQYCHHHHVVHRDLKPENFVFDTPAEDSSMRLIDFGCARQVQDHEELHDFAGSPYYVAPEVMTDGPHSGRVWKCADMWSVGVMIFLFVCGYPPFNGRSTREIFAAIQRGKFRFPVTREGETPLSKEVQDLIKRLLCMDPSRRLTADEALKHPWIAGEVAPSAPLPVEVVESIKAFQSQCQLKRAVARALAARMTDIDRTKLATVFESFDKNGDGQLGPEEIADMMKKIGAGGEAAARHLMAQFDEDGDGKINPTELAAAQMAGRLNDAHEIDLKAGFEMFDADNDGYITSTELEQICDFLTPRAVKQLISEVDANSDGKINFNEWLAAMKDKRLRKAASLHSSHRSHGYQSQQSMHLTTTQQEHKHSEGSLN